jgi:hypothetical protein
MAAMRAMFMPWHPSGIAQPAITSSTSPSSNPGMLSTTAFNVWAR